MEKQFDFEQQIMSTWNIVEDLQDLVKGVLEFGFTSDQVSNVLLGLADLYGIRFESLFLMFESSIRESAQLKEHAARAEQDLLEMKLLVGEFLRILKINEESGSGVEFSPTKIICCRTDVTERINAILGRLDEIVR